MDKRKIVISSNTSWFIYNFHRELASVMQSQGYQVVVVAPRDDYSKKLEKLDIEFYDIGISNKGTHPIEDIKLFFRFYKLYRSISPDLILHYTIKPNIYGTMAAGVLTVPTISTIAGLGTVFLNNKLSSHIARLLYKVALRIPKRVFFLNSYDRKLFLDSNIVKVEKTGLIPGSGIDTEKFKPVNIDRNPQAPICFLLIARLIKDKGVVEFVQAAEKIRAKYPDSTGLKFCIIGEYYHGNPTSITEKEMQHWVEEGYVDYLGTSDDIRPIIAKADCIVLPSYREGISQVLLEAASMGKALIATDVPGCKEVIDDGVNGLLCHLKDADSLAKQIIKMSNLSDEERDEMGRRGREKVISQFEEKIVNDAYMRAVSAILS
ncbi:MAG: glycosyltransferase family 4 protein [Campylobacterota bacterium]|nr:glycosyltransferase family 4 protein [Campylobacterota bacterium]